jgi:biotin transporter BioY
MKKLIREILVVLAGFVLCSMLIAFCGWITFNYTTFGKWTAANAQTGRFLTEEETLETFGETPEQIFENHLRISTYFMLPLVAIVVGAFAGIFMQGFVWLKALITLVPLHIFNLDNLFFLITYAMLAIGTSFFFFRLVRQRPAIAFFSR